MTVLDLLKLAVDLIDDAKNLSSYYTGNFGKVTMIVSELVSKCVGVKTTVYTVTPGSPPYTPSDTNFTPVALPDDLTADEQIEYVDVEAKTETHDGALYLLVPANYTQEITVLYKPRVTEFSSVSDELPLTDEAVRNVAAYGLAEMLSLANAEEYTDYYRAKYIQAKNEWIGKDYTPQEVRDYYGW